VVSELSTGKIKWFNAKREFGYVVCSTTGSEFPFKLDDTKCRESDLVEGASVAFQVVREGRSDLAKELEVIDVQSDISGKLPRTIPQPRQDQP
jgi:cold shock CspA family protein